jgi:hypothetical protein
MRTKSIPTIAFRATRNAGRQHCGDNICKSIRPHEPSPSTTASRVVVTWKVHMESSFRPTAGPCFAKAWIVLEPIRRRDGKWILQSGTSPAHGVDLDGKTSPSSRIVVVGLSMDRPQTSNDLQGQPIQFESRRPARGCEFRTAKGHRSHAQLGSGAVRVQREEGMSKFAAQSGGRACRTDAACTRLAEKVRIGIFCAEKYFFS